MPPATAAARPFRLPRDQRRIALGFARLLRGLVANFGGQKGELAADIGVSASTLSHMLMGRGLPGIETCLRLAARCGAPPGRVLRAAGKNDIADILEKVYGSDGVVAGNERCTPQEIRILTAHRALPPSGQRVFEQLYTLASGDQP